MIPRRLVPALAVGLAVLGLRLPAAQAHCDTMDGPVVADARAALAAGDVARTLKWVHADAEPEVRAAFARARAARASGGAARDLADTWFFETLVRLHRAGEGAPFTGVKPAGTPVPHAVAAADRALAGNLPVAELSRHLAASVTGGVEQRYARVVELKKRADTSAEAGRAYVAAYVDYVHYVEAVAQTAASGGAHGHAEATD